MTASSKTSATMLWLKQMTTSTFTNINKKMDRFAFLKRHPKAIGSMLAAWLVLAGLSFWICNGLSHRQVTDYLARQVQEANRLAEQCGPPLLEDDILGLNRLISEFAASDSVVFAAIADHENRIKAHSDPEWIGRQMEVLSDVEPLAPVDEVTITLAKTTRDVPVIAFVRDITFSGVKIGSVHFGLAASGYLSSKNAYQLLRWILLSLFTVLLVVGLLLVDRRREPAAIEDNDAVEDSDASKIGPYQLRDLIAKGGMAELYLADYIRGDGFRRTVAVKKVLPHLAENQDFIDMFIREARLAALLQHPNIVQIFDFGKISNVYFIAMEYIDGKTLGELMAHLKTGLPVDLAVFLITKVSLALHYSHSRKDDQSGRPLDIVHRDVSPQNVLISYMGEVKISDFGISKATSEPSLTQAGVIKGKLSYLSPEQALGQPVDRQSDVYALGLVFYEILTGQRLYQFDTDIEAIRAIPETVIPPLIQVRPDVTEALSDIVMRCLEKDKALRYPDAKALHDDLMQLKADQRIAYDASDLANFMKTTFDHA